jgi:hypothetical protein
MKMGDGGFRPVLTVLNFRANLASTP